MRVAVVAAVVVAVLGGLCAGVQAQVTFEASVPTTVNGVQTQGIVVGCQTVSGQSIVDTTTITVALTNGVTLPLKVDCRAPVYMYDLLPAGSVPQRVIFTVLPLCDAPLSAYTEADTAGSQQSRRLLRMIAAGMHLGHGKHRDLGASVFRHWQVEDWAAYADGSAHLEHDLGLSAPAAAALRRNITRVRYMHNLYQAAPGVMRMGMDALLGTNRSLFPPFMRDADGSVKPEWAYKVNHGDDWQADAHTHPEQRRSLQLSIWGANLANIVGGINSNEETGADNSKSIDGMALAMLVQANASTANARNINATRDFAALTRDMLDDTASALGEAEKSISALQALGDLNNQGVAGNLRLLEDAAKDRQNMSDTAYEGRKDLRTEMLFITDAAKVLAQEMQNTTNDLRTFTINVATTLAQQLEASDKRAADVTRQLMQAISDGEATTETLALHMYKQQTQQQAKRDLTGLFWRVEAQLAAAQWKPFLWQDTGADEDAARMGQRPSAEQWADGSIGRRVQLDEFQVLFLSAGAEGASGPAFVNHVLHEHTFNIVCDAKALMNNVAPWYTSEDIRKFVGPRGCLPLASGTVGGVPTTSPDGDPKTTASGAELVPCVCWIEFKARSCVHNETLRTVNPLDTAGLSPSVDIGLRGLDADALCTGAHAASVDTGGYVAMQENGIALYTATDLLTTPSDGGLAWYNTGGTAEAPAYPQKYIQDWSSFMNLLEWGCGAERFGPFSGNPLATGYERVKFFGDFVYSNTYALLTSSRMSSLYTSAATNASVAFVQKIASYANTAECAAQNTAGEPCFAVPGRRRCPGCQACAADAVSLARVPEDGDPAVPTTLAQAVLTAISKAWVGLVYNLADMDVSLYGVMPADVALSTNEFSYSPATKTSFKCRLLSSVYTLGEPEPLSTQQLRSVHKYMSVRMDPWGNNGGSPTLEAENTVLLSNGLPALPGVWEQETSDPSMFNDATVFLESNMVWAGSKKCMVGLCPSPHVFLASSNALLPVTETRYTYNVPQGLLSTSPDPAGRIGSPTYIKSSKTPAELGIDGLTLNQWVADHPGDSFDAAFASASLHHYYMPLEADEDGDNIRCAAAMTAAMGPVCGLLDNYVIYTPESSDEYGDPAVASECNKDTVLCFRPKRFSYKQQFVVPQGTTTQSFVSACPTVNAASILNGIPVVFLSHPTTSVIQARITMDGPGCLRSVLTVSVPPGKNVAVSTEVCGAMTISLERLNAATGGYESCGTDEDVDVKPPPQFGGDAANVTFVQPITYVQSTDDTRLIDVGEQQNKVLGDMRNLLASMATHVYGADSDAMHTLLASAPTVFNLTAFGEINRHLHASARAAADAENARVAAAADQLKGIQADSTTFSTQSHKLRSDVNVSIDALRSAVDKVQGDMPRLNAAYDTLNSTATVAITANLKAAAASTKAANNALKLTAHDTKIDSMDSWLHDLEDGLKDVGKVLEDVGKVVAKVVEGGIDMLGDLMGALGGGFLGILFTLMMPCIIAVCAAAALAALMWFCCKDNIKAGVATVAAHPDLLALAGAPLGPAGMAALRVAGAALDKNKNKNKGGGRMATAAAAAAASTRLGGHYMPQHHLDGVGVLTGHEGTTGTAGATAVVAMGVPFAMPGDVGEQGEAAETDGLLV
jgi:hypothetical protein